MAGSTEAAYISEIDLGGPAGQGVELSQVDHASDYTLLFINASPTSSFLFGMVMDVLHIPACTGQAGVAMVSDTAWPGGSVLTTPLASLSLASGDDELPLTEHTMLVVMQGRSELGRANNPLSDPVAKARYDATTLTDWLVLSTGDQAAAYEANYDVDHINSQLGIDLLSRLVDAEAGRVIGRTNAPGQAMDMDTFFVGDPDPVSNQFDADAQWTYTYTPGMSSLPLAAHSPEPRTLTLLGLSIGLVCRRPRR